MGTESLFGVTKVLEIDSGDGMDAHIVNEINATEFYTSR